MKQKECSSVEKEDRKGEPGVWGELGCGLSYPGQWWVDRLETCSEVVRYPHDQFHETEMKLVQFGYVFPCNHSVVCGSWESVGTSVVVLLVEFNDGEKSKRDCGLSQWMMMSMTHGQGQKWRWEAMMLSQCGRVPMHCCSWQGQNLS